MFNHYKRSPLTLWLFVFSLCTLSCSEQAQFEKQNVQFTINPSSADGGPLENLSLPETAKAVISIMTKSGDEVFLDHQVSLARVGTDYVTDRLELASGAYTMTAFTIVNDSTDWFAGIDRDASLPSATYGLPYDFSVTQNSSNIDVHVVDVRDGNGDAASRSQADVLAVTVYEKTNGSLMTTNATAEVWQNGKILRTFSLSASLNVINLGGDPKAPYSLTTYSSTGAKTQTVLLKQLKKEKGKPSLSIVLDPALILTIESSVDDASADYRFFNFQIGGDGHVNVNWGNGTQSQMTLPFETDHEYFAGTYKMIITGDVDHITDFSGFSYSINIFAITGLPNLTALRVYDPSWGAVPIKVDLSQCHELQTINVAKYGAPYEPCDLRTEFKLPSYHQINSFTFDAPSFDINREWISAAELDVMFGNIYNNAVSREIRNGTFLVSPVVAPSAETQAKIDILRNQYGWRVGFNEDIYNFDSGAGGRTRSTSDPDMLRAEWLKARFTRGEKIVSQGRVGAM